MIDQLIRGIKSQELKSISKSISIIENNSSDSKKLIDKVFPLINNAYKIGITGPPGAGKSTITNLLIKYFRKLEKRVGVLLVDPTSPFSGGAVLGDRVRMNLHYNDPDVFVRSLATRGSTGGLSTNINEIADVLDASGFDIIIFETVGVGQIEIDVVEKVDSVALVLVPESGDDIQMLKAGIIEIADIFVINKSDRKDSDKLFSSLENILSISDKKKNIWSPLILKTIGTKNVGIDELAEKLLEHNSYISTGRIKDKKYSQRYIQRINNILIEQSVKKFWTKKNKILIDKEIKKDIKDRISPSNLLDKIFNNE